MSMRVIFEACKYASKDKYSKLGVNPGQFNKECWRFKCPKTVPGYWCEFVCA